MAGSSLQNGKYVIQAVLHQSDFGVTYQAMHTFLEQSVIIQTFNDSLRDHSNFAQLRQMFAEEARKRSSASGSQPFKIVDGFEEGEMPFAVIQLGANQPVPKLREWLPLTKLIIPAAVTAANGTADGTANGTVLQETAQAIATNAMLANGTASSMGASVQSPDLAASGVNSSVNSGVALTETAAQSATAQPTVALASPPQQRPPVRPLKSKKRHLLPIALVITASMAGLAGASVGWLLRFNPSPATAGNGPAEVPFNLGGEQTFPPTANWPITEQSDVTPPDGGLPDYGGFSAPRRNRELYVPEVAPPRDNRSRQPRDYAPQPSTEFPKDEIPDTLSGDRPTKTPDFDSPSETTTEDPVIAPPPEATTNPAPAEPANNEPAPAPADPPAAPPTEP